MLSFERVNVPLPAASKDSLVERTTFCRLGFVYGFVAPVESLKNFFTTTSSFAGVMTGSTFAFGAGFGADCGAGAASAAGGAAAPGCAGALCGCWGGGACCACAGGGGVEIRTAFRLTRYPCLLKRCRARSTR